MIRGFHDIYSLDCVMPTTDTLCQEDVPIMEDVVQLIAEGCQRTASNKEIKAVTPRLDGIDRQVDRSAHLLMEAQRRTLESLATGLTRLEDVLAVSSQAHQMASHHEAAIFRRSLRA
jgi:hypothetical protein